MARIAKAGRQNPRLTIGLLTQMEPNTLSVELWRGVEDATREFGANLLHIPGDILDSPIGFRAQANAVYELVSDERLDGLVVWGGLLSQYVATEEFVAFCERFRPLPVVNVGMRVAGIPSLWVDNYAGMRDVVSHLVEAHRYQRIAFLRGVDNPEGEERYRAYATMLREHGLSQDPTLITPWSDQQRSDGVAAMQLLLDERNAEFEAVVAATDALALGALDVLQARGIRVPDEVAVVGFDDVEGARTSVPPLTTVRQPMYEVARRAAEVLLARLAGEPTPDQVPLTAELVLRQSCGCPDVLIVQAGVTGAIPVPEKHAKAETWPDAFAARHQAILSEMEKAAGQSARMLDAAWGERLLEALSTELLHESPGTFVSALNEILRRVAVAGGDVVVWHQVLSVVRRQMLPCLANDCSVLLQSENLWHQARVAVARAVERMQAHRALLAQQQAQMLQETGQSLLAATDMEDLTRALERELPRLGVPSCYLSLYEGPKLPAHRSKLILAYDANGSPELGEGGLRFPSRQLVPDGLFRRAERYAMSLEPLYFQENQYGFALLEVSPWQAEIRETLRLQLGSALQKASLVQKLEDRALKLRTAAEVSRAAGTILDPDELFQQVVGLIRHQFHYYYVGLFLVDGDGTYASLRAGTGEAGQAMLEQGHKLAVGGESMIGWCVANKQTRIALDVGEEAVRFDNPMLPETRSEMALPLVSRGEAIGALTIQSSEEAAFSDEDVVVLQTMADQLANAIENARLFERAQLSAEDQATLRRIATAVNRSLEMQELVESTLETVLVSLGFDAVLVSLSDEETGRLGLAGQRGLPEPMARKLEQDGFVGTLCDYVFQTGETVGISDIRQGAPVDVSDVIAHGLYTYAGAPLTYQDQRIGTICCFNRSVRKLTRRELLLLEGVGTQVGVGAANARLYTQSQSALRELEAAQRRYMRLAWADYGSAEEAVRGYVRTEDEARPTAEAWLPAMTSAVEQQDTVVEQDEQEGTVLALPLTVTGEVIGVLGGYRAAGEGWNEDDITAVEAIVEQMALALDNQRLSDEEQRARKLLDQRLKELACLSELGRRMDESPEVGELLEWVTGRIPSAMQYQDLCLAAIEFEDQVYGPAEALGLPCQMVQSLLIGGRQAGRITIAYAQERDFLDEESALLGDVARRLSGYIENLRLFEETQSALAEVEAVHRSYLRRAWQDHLHEQQLLERSGFVYEDLKVEGREEVVAVADLWLPEMERALAEGGPASAGSGSDGERTGLAIPLVIRGETIGVLGVEVPGGDHQWTEEDRSLIEAVSEQLAQTLENARLFAETQRRAERELQVREITARIRASTDVRNVLETAAVELGRALGTSRAVLRLTPGEPALDGAGGSTPQKSPILDDKPASGGETG